MVGEYSRNDRPLTSTLVNKFETFQDKNNGFFSEIETGVFFINFSCDPVENESNDESGLRTQFQFIKDGKTSSVYPGQHCIIDEEKFAQLQREEEVDNWNMNKEEAENAGEGTVKKRPRTDEYSAEASGSAMVVEAIAQPFPVNIANESQPENTEEVQALHQAKDAEIQMLKAELEVRPTMDDILKLQAQINTKDTKLEDLQKHNDGYVADGFEAHCKIRDLIKTLKEAHTDNETLKSQVAELDAKVTDLESRPPAPAGPTDATLRMELAKEKEDNHTLRGQLAKAEESRRQAAEYGNSREALYRNEQSIKFDMQKNHDKAMMDLRRELKKR